MLIAVQFGIMSDCWLVSVVPFECSIVVEWGLFVTDCWLACVAPSECSIVVGWGLFVVTDCWWSSVCPAGSGSIVVG